MGRGSDGNTKIESFEDWLKRHKKHDDSDGASAGKKLAREQSKGLSELLKKYNMIPKFVSSDQPLQQIDGIIDDGIVDVVGLLRYHGFDTFSSCQCGNGHMFDCAMIRLYADENDNDNMDKTQSRLIDILSIAGYGGYYIKTYKSYQAKGRVFGVGFIEVEFWQDSPIVPDKEDNTITEA